MLKLIIAFLILYLIIFCSMLDDVDRFSLYYRIKHISKPTDWAANMNVDSSVKMNKLYDTFISPFLGTNYFVITHAGSLYGGYVYEYSPKLADILNNKLLTYEIFKKEHIEQPELYISIANKRINYVKDIDPNLDYIVKPIDSSYGDGVELLKGKDIIKKLDEYDNILVQQYLYDCTTNSKARHFRFVTFYDGTPFRIYESYSNDKIISNKVGDSEQKVCINLKCDYLSNEQQFILESFMKKLQKLHKKIFNKVFSIGWDIVFYCENGNIKIACLEGNIHHGSWDVRERNTDYIDNLIKSYKDKYRYFINNKLYLN